MIRRSDAPADTVKVTSLPEGLGLRLADGGRPGPGRGRFKIHRHDSAKFPTL